MTNEELKLVNKLFELWERLAEAGQLMLGRGFNQSYKELEQQVKNLNEAIVHEPPSGDVD